MVITKTDDVERNDNSEFLSVLIGTSTDLPAIQHLTRYFDRKLIERACHVHNSHEENDNESHSSSICSSPSSLYGSSDMMVLNHSRPSSILDEYALIDHGRRLTFGQFRRCYRRLAHLFRTTLVPTNRRQRASEDVKLSTNVVVGVAMQPSIELIVTLFGLLEADCLFVPIDVTLPAERMQAILVDAQVNFIITDEHSHGAVAESRTISTLVNNVYQFRNLVASERDSGGDGWDTPITPDLLRDADNDNTLLPMAMSSNDDQLLIFADDKQNDDDSRTKVAARKSTSSAGSSQIAGILYTSGSTGTPKGVPLRHASLMNMVQWRKKEMPFLSDEVGVMKSVFTFIDGVIEIFEALLQLRPLVLLTKSDTIDPATLLSTLAKYKIYRLAIVPSHLATLLQYVEQDQQEQPAGEKLSMQRLSKNHKRDSSRHSLRIIVCDGEVLPPRTIRNTLRFFPGVKVYNIYGTTETCGDNTYVCIENEHQLDDLIEQSSNPFMSTQGEISSPTLARTDSPVSNESPTGSSKSGISNGSLVSQQQHGSVVPIGLPCDNVNVYVVSPEGELVEKGGIGEVFISGIPVANGYIGGTMDKFVPNSLRPPGSDEATHGMLYSTGDVGYISPLNNMVYLPGRREDLVKIRGQRIHLAEVNAAIMSLSEVNECVTLTEKTFIQTKLLSFFNIAIPKNVKITSKEEAEHDIIQRLEEVLKQRLPCYAIPVLIPYRNGRQLPRLPNGKLDKKKLTDYYRNTVTNADESDTSVLGIVASTLGVAVEKLDKTRGFFENGGNSLNAIATVNKLRQYGHFFTVTEFLQCATLAEIESRCAAHSEIARAVGDDNNETDKNVDTLSARDEYVFVPLSEVDCTKAATQMHDSYAVMGDWERYIEPPDAAVYVKSTLEIWPDLIAQNMSFGAVKKSTNELVSLSLSYDAQRPFAEPEEELHPFFQLESEILDEIMAKSVLDELPQEPGKVWFAFSDNTAVDISDAEKVRLMWLMQVEQVRRARKLGYTHIVANNTSPLTQAIGQQLGYKTMKQLRIKDIVLSNGKKPFQDASDDHIARVDVLFLDQAQQQ